MRCVHNACVAIQITIRNVPEDIRDELSARAARRRQSMQEFLLTELEALTRRPSLDAWLDRIQERKSMAPRNLSTSQILESRDLDRK